MANKPRFIMQELQIDYIFFYFVVIMANLTKLEFTALDISGKNYLPWTLDAEIHLTANNLGETIKAGNKTTLQERAKAMIFLRHHLHEDLKREYLTVKDPLELWEHLKERYDHQRQVLLPNARYKWMHLRLQDFKSVSEYNSAMFSITSELKLCGEKITDADMLEKTFSTFHASNMLLQQQYRERGFKKYHELIAVLLIAEQNNELLLKNHQSRPTGSNPLPEANATYMKGRDRGRGNYHRNTNNNGRQRGYNNNNWRRDGESSRSYDNKRKAEKGKNSHDEPTKKLLKTCYKCGMRNHLSKACRTPKHFVDLYQASLKQKTKGVETNFIENDGNFDINFLESEPIPDFLNDDSIPKGDLDLNDPNMGTHLDASDFFDDIEEEDALIIKEENSKN